MKKILVVEDEKKISSLMKEIIEGMGHKVDITEDGLDGYVEFQMNKYDLILTDLMMPTHGSKLIELIRKIDKEVPIIVVSATSEIYDKDQAKKKGANGFISKPFAVKDLMSEVEKNLK